MSAYRQDSTVHVDYVLESDELAEEWTPLVRRTGRIANLSLGGVLAGSGLVFLVTLPPIAAAIAFAVGALAIGWFVSRTKTEVSGEALYGETWDTARRIRLEADESELALIDPLIETRLAWDMVFHWSESDAAIRIYTQASGFYVVPKRVFRSPEQLTTLRQLLDAHVRPGGDADVARAERAGWGAQALYHVAIGLLVLSLIEGVARLAS